MEAGGGSDLEAAGRHESGHIVHHRLTEEMDERVLAEDGARPSSENHEHGVPVQCTLSRAHVVDCSEVAAEPRWQTEM